MGGVSRCIVVVSLVCAAVLVGGCFPDPQTCDGCGESGGSDGSGIDPTVTTTNSATATATATGGPSTSADPTSNTSPDDDDTTGDTETGTESDTETGTDSEPSSTGDDNRLNTPSDCGGGEALAWNESADRVTGEGFRISFAENEWHNVSSYEVGGTEMLFGGGGSAPNFDQNERLWGVGLFSEEAASEYAWMDLSSVNSPYVEVSAGPAVVFVTVLWGDHCGKPPCASMTGTTHFTIIPDGRIVRDDAVVVPARTSNNDWLTSHLSLRPALFDSYSWGGTVTQLPTDLAGFNAAQGAGGGALIHDSTLSLDHEQWLCVSNVQGGGPAVGYASFPHPFVHDPSSPYSSARITETAVAGPPSYGVALQFDWVRSDDVGGDMGENYGGYFMAYADPDDDGDCGCIGVQAEAYMNPPTIAVVQGGSVAYSEFMSKDGNITGDVDNDGFYERGGYYGVDETTPGQPVVVQWSSALQSVLLFVEADDVPQRVFVGDQELGPNVWQTQSEGGVAWVYIGADIPADTDVTIEL